jgi:hypothetical protein
MKRLLYLGKADASTVQGLLPPLLLHRLKTAWVHLLATYNLLTLHVYPLRCKLNLRMLYWYTFNYQLYITFNIRTIFSANLLLLHFRYYYIYQHHTIYLGWSGSDDYPKRMREEYNRGFLSFSFSDCKQCESCSCYIYSSYIALAARYAANWL